MHSVGQVIILESAQLPRWAGHLADCWVDACKVDNLRTAGGGKVVITTWSKRRGRFRQRVLRTPSRLAADLSRAREQGRIPGAQLPAVEAMLAWCRSKSGDAPAGEE